MKLANDSDRLASTPSTDAAAKRAVDRKRWGRALVRTTLSVAAFGMFATGGVGFLHTPAGRPYLMKLAGIAGCPMGGASAAQVEAIRRSALQKDLGGERAPSRPALGFALDASTVADVRAWQSRSGLECSEERETTLLKCNDVPARALARDESQGSLTEVAFGFSTRGVLVAISTLYSHRSAEDVRRIAIELRQNAENALGPPTKSAGSFEQTGATATVGYRFRDYSADITSTQVPGSGYALREQYLSTLLPESPVARGE